MTLVIDGSQQGWIQNWAHVGSFLTQLFFMGYATVWVRGALGPVAPWIRQ